MRSAWLRGQVEPSVRPMEKIDGIKIIQVDGLNRSSGDNSLNTMGSGSGNLAEQAVAAALTYRAQQPILDAVLGEIGVKEGDLNGLVEAVHREIQSFPGCRHSGTGRGITSPLNCKCRSVKAERHWHR